MEEDDKGEELRAQSEGDVSTMAGNHNFRVAIKKGTLAAAPTIQRKISYFEWSIVTDPIEVDGDREYSRDDLDPSSDTLAIPDSMENGDEEPDRINNIEENGRSLEEEPHRHHCQLIPCIPTHTGTFPNQAHSRDMNTLNLIPLQ